VVTYSALPQIMVAYAHPPLNKVDPDLNVPRKLIVRGFDGLIAAAV
jgi:hypothetical protein